MSQDDEINESPSDLVSWSAEELANYTVPTPLSAERLAEIRTLQGEWTSYAASKPWRAAGSTPQLATTYAGELLAHLDAREAAFASVLKGLLAEVRPVAAGFDPKAQERMRINAIYNRDIHVAAAVLGIDLTK